MIFKRVFFDDFDSMLLSSLNLMCNLKKSIFKKIFVLKFVTYNLIQSPTVLYNYVSFSLSSKWKLKVN